MKVISTETGYVIDETVVPPPAWDGLAIAKKPHRDVKQYLSSSPYIETRNQRIRKAAKEVMRESADKTDWEKVERIYDWVREKVEYKNGKLKGALAALRDGDGDCEELTSLFIAMCRVNDIPARTVWIPGHCYPEFYLEDSDGNGYWFPCQAAGTRQFGRMDEYRPVLQKGDRFKVPEKRTPVRYVAEFFTCDVKGKSDPTKVYTMLEDDATLRTQITSSPSLERWTTRQKLAANAVRKRARR